MPRHSLDLGGVVDQFLYLRVALVHDAQVGRALQRGGNGHVQLHRDGLCHPVHLLVVHPHHPADVPHAAARRHGAEGDDLRDAVLAVLANDVVDDLLTALVAEVDVEVGHADTLRVEKALEQQVILHRVDAGDANAVGRDAAGARAAPRPDRYAVALGVVDEVPDNQVVVDIAHLLDDRQLVLQPLLIFLRGILAVTLCKALPALFPEEGDVVPAVRHLELGEDVVPEGELHLTPLGDLDGVVQRLPDGLLVAGALPHGVEHLLAGFDVKFLGLKLHPVVLFQRVVGLDAEEDLLGHAVLFGQVVAVVGRHQPDVQLLCQAD